MIEKRLLPMRRVDASRAQSLRDGILNRFHPRREGDLLVIDCDKCVQVIWHNHVPADPRPVRRTFLSKTQKSFVNWGTGKNLSPIFRARCDEVDRRGERTGARDDAIAAFFLRRS
jgi:hypothetical protein